MEDISMDADKMPESAGGAAGNSMGRGDTSARKRRGPLVLIVIVLAVLLVPVLVAGYLGFVPGLSGLMGANKPRDLGVSYTAADYASYLKKTGVQFQDFSTAPDNRLRPGKKTVFADPRTAEDMVLTQEEITAAINTVGWAWMPVTNAQVRFSSGDTIEVSGNLNAAHVSDFVRFIGGVGYEEPDVNKAVAWGQKFLGNAAVYVKGRAAVEHGMLSINVDKAQVGRFTAPTDVAGKVFLIGTTNATTRADNFHMTSLTVEDGRMLFSGTYPTTVYVKK